MPLTMNTIHYTSTTQLEDRMRCHSIMERDDKPEFCTDVPEQLGGRGAMPTPGEMLAATVASCMLSMIAFTGAKRHIPVQGASIQAACGEGKSGIGSLHFRIHLPHVHDEEQLHILKNAVASCPVGSSIRPEIHQELIWES